LISQAIIEAENSIFERYKTDAEKPQIPMLFIVASPRTGSTLLYQLMLEVFGFFYFSNFITDHFAEYPAVGVALDLQANPRKPISFNSNYGKTVGQFGPSEASWIFRNWFGGKHPSQTMSAKILPGKEKHMKLSLNAIGGMTGRPLLTKNAWNCFRIRDLCRMFQNVRFLWLRRDIIWSSISDLEARYHRGSREVWNSATTSNYKEIQKLPYWEQVVEQQFEYNHAVRTDLIKYSQNRFIELWYEDICNDTGFLMNKLQNIFYNWGWKIGVRHSRIPKLKASAGPSGMTKDIKKIKSYVKSNTPRFGKYLYVNGKNCMKKNSIYE
jgi:hypothetical protein